MTPAFRSLADADAVFTVAMADGASLPVYRVGAATTGPTLLFGHANGMAAGSYGPWLRRLAEGARVFAFDARGHGGAVWPAGPLERVFAVERFADDLVQVTRRVAAEAGVAEIAYIGHSLGAVVALRLLALGEAPDWPRVVLFEPPIFPPPAARCHAEAVEKQRRLVAGTLKRRALWPSPEAFAERLRGRGMFARFEGAMLTAHCRATLQPEGDGFRLACPPEIESFIFESQAATDTWRHLGHVARAVTLVGGDAAVPDNDWVSSALSEMAQEMPAARLVQIRGAGHLLISEQPERCARIVLESLGA